MRNRKTMPAHHLDFEVARPRDLVPAEHLPAVLHFFLRLKAEGGDFWLSDQVARALREYIDSTPWLPDSTAQVLRKLFLGCQEVIHFPPHFYALLRPRAGQKLPVRLHPRSASMEEVTRGHYLFVKDALIQGSEIAGQEGLIIDFFPYFTRLPRIEEQSEMGEGLSFLNRTLSGQMYQQPELFRLAMLAFLEGAHTNGSTILTNRHLAEPETLKLELDAVRAYLGDLPGATPLQEVEHTLRTHGFEAGWGRDAGEIAAHLGQLARLMDAPDPERMEQFLERLPLVRTVLMVSPHGWFAQEGVLGRPDTGGQVTYVLDQARALERQIQRSFQEAGITATPKVVILTRLIPEAEGTTCDQPREKVHGSENCWIIRVPFQDEQGRDLPHWVSRFTLWPYLERFADASRQPVITELLGKPDLIIGHYTDGNLVAYRLAEVFGSTHCAAVHALEKTKYLFSDLHWADMEREYHWSCHFTADLIAYNAADFIITSSYREIAGTATEMGFFESYEVFSMPGLYRVVSGLDPQLARYNIVPPGASEDCFFPYQETHRRPAAVTAEMEALFFGAETAYETVGRLTAPELPPIFAMSRVDRVKNLAGLVECFAQSESLRKQANLILVSSVVNPRDSEDREEREQVQRIKGLLDDYGLHGNVRWVGARLSKLQTGEAYRVMADHGGVFAQPALMETFGLTVVEAMASGLPVVVTCFGGPSEIVVQGESGDVVDPNDAAAFASALERLVTGRALWNTRSEAGIARVLQAYSWEAHARRMLRLANVYSYWNYLDVMNRQALDQYLHTLYHTVYRPRAQAILER